MRNRIILLAAALLLIPGCRKAGMEERSLSTLPLSFGLGSLQRQVSTKSLADYESVEDLSTYTDGIGVYAAYLPEDKSFPGDGSNKPQAMINNRQVIRDDKTTALSAAGVSAQADTRLWYCYPAAYWPYAGKLSLFAYAPYRETPDADSLMVTTAYSANGWPSLKFTVHPHAKKQLDLLAGCALDKTATSGSYRDVHGSVDLDMKHQLTWIDFRARAASDMNADAFNNWVASNFAGKTTQIGIASILLEGLLDCRTGHFSASGFSWDDTPSDDKYSASYLLSWENGDFKPMATSHLTIGDDLTYIPLLVGDGDGLKKQTARLYLMPQELRTSATATIEYGIFTLEGETYVPQLLYQTQFHIGNLTDSGGNRVNYTWEAGHHIVYNMVLNMSEVSNSTVTATIYDWETEATYEHDNYLE